MLKEEVKMEIPEFRKMLKVLHDEQMSGRIHIFKRCRDFPENSITGGMKVRVPESLKSTELEKYFTIAELVEYQRKRFTEAFNVKEAS